MTDKWDGEKPKGQTHCPCAQLREYLKNGTGAEKEITQLRLQSWAPCWRCHEDMGCMICQPRTGDAVCPNCGVYTNGVAFTLNAERLPPEVFETYPAGWRIKYYAAHGMPNPQLLPYVRHHLHWPKAAVRLEVWSLDLANGAIVDKKGEEETKRARQLLGDYMQTRDYKGFFQRMRKALGEKMPTSLREPGEEG